MKIKRGYFMPSIADIIFCSLFITISLLLGESLLKDGDTGYHIRAGEYILNTFSIPKLDMFSFHIPTLHWIAHEWLSEAIMALIHNAYGLTGIVIFYSFIIASIYYLLFKMLRSYHSDFLICILMVILVIACSQIHWLARPHIFSMLLILVWYYIIDQFQYNDQNHLYLLPFIMLLWVNLHGSFVAGFLFNMIYIFGNFLNFITCKNDKRDIYLKKIKPFAIVTFICLLVSLINPYGYHLLLFPFKLITDKFTMDHVKEFLSPNFHVNIFKPFEILLLLTLSVFAISKKTINKIELILMLVFIHMSLYSARYIPLFAIIAAPILTRYTETIFKKSNNKVIHFFQKRSKGFSEIDNQAKGFFWPVMTIILVFTFTACMKIDYKFDEKSKPVAAVEFIKKEPINGNMFNNDEFGDYIIYQAHSRYKVFIDGRLDMYGVEKFKEYYKLTKIEQDWEDIIEKYNISWIIFNADSVLSRHLLEQDNWHLVYADEVANIFVSVIPENKYLIDKYRSIKPIIKTVK